MKKTFFILTAILFFILTFWGLKLFIDTGNVQVKEETIYISQWHKEHEALKIVILADLHVGTPQITLKKLEQIVKKVNSLNPDLIIILGDYVIRGVVLSKLTEPEPIANKLSQLKPKYGTYSILGNHDWWHDGEKVKNALEKANIKVLENDSIPITINHKTFWLAGIGDLYTRPVELNKTLSKINDQSPIILLSHSPDIFPEVPSRVSITLSGHTHGGQINLPILGRPFVPSIYGAKYASGYIKENNNSLYVSPGISTSVIPLRIGVNPEINVLKLVERKTIK